ncbi:dynactin [Cylindrobasidium torrendii FP15055 ss-10]|uniref:Dynactin n=1 Tax=Cylindrobasidium torrendii FP15055 ss-10 TaxID=1314674 RepID=A0A0D7BSU9_9AGAR|nr:dynactin [Cylindrobasidium torrendii FP15055 ss-10]
MSISTVNHPVGTIVELQVGRGVVRWSGTISNKPGKFFGIELYEANGKNDGSFEGHSYFRCPPNHGLFVRNSGIKAVVGIETPPEPVRKPALTQRPSLGHQRTPSITRANSLRTSSPSSRSSSPVKVPPNGVRSRLGPSTPTKGTPASSSSATIQTRKSLLRKSPSSPPPPAVKVAPKASPPSPPRKASPNGVSRRVSSPLSQPSSILATTPPPEVFPSQARTVSPLVQTTTRPIVDEQELQELRAKIRVLEVKRGDDSRNIRELEARLADAEQFVALRPKLQAKLSQLQTELIATKRELSDAQQLAQHSDSRVLDNQEMLEMAMLDKEVAEERAELAEAELEDIKERLAIAEVELEVYKESEELEREEVEEGAAPVKDSMAYVQLEKQNERLKEALLRLRDMTQESDLDQRRRISEMEKDMTGLDELRAQFASATIKLSNAEIQIEDLKLQLDDALGAEDMVVQLTERNLVLGEKIEEMRITIEDLEALKELNDELEENHIETEKALHEDLDAKDIQIHQYTRKIETLEDACVDFEGTITQFRDLVVQLQGELDSLRLQTQTAQNESATAASQTAAMLSLNMKLQSSAAKNQARNVELELNKLEARESRELLQIVQPYLPQLYVENDFDATSCYLFFRRMATKLDIINTVVSLTHGIGENVNGSGSDVLIGVCDLRTRLVGLSTICKRFATVLRKCDVQTFLDRGRVFHELAHAEKRIDLHIDLLRRDEFREFECVTDIDNIANQFEHVDNKFFEGFETELAEREQGLVLAFDCDLDTFMAAVGHVRTSVQQVLKEADVVLDLAGMNAEPELLDPLQKILDGCKSAKLVSRKLVRRLEDLSQESFAAKAIYVPHMRTLVEASQKLVAFAFTLARSTTEHISDARGAKASFQLVTMLSFVKQATTTTVGMEARVDASFWDPISDALKRFAQDASNLLAAIFEPDGVSKMPAVNPPWVTRIDEIKTALAVNVEAERKVAQLNDEIQGLLRTLKTKDQYIQESGVKIELMERRMETVKKQADAIQDLEVELNKAKKQEKTYEEAMEQLQSDLDAAEQEVAKLKTTQIVGGHDRQGSNIQVVEAEPTALDSNLETSHLLEQLDALRGTVRYLRNENSYLKGQDLIRELDSLPPLAAPIPRSATPPLDPSYGSDTDDSDSDRAPTPPTLRSVTTESKLLYRDLIKFSTTPKVVDLSAVQKLRGDKGGKAWMPKSQTPAQQVLQRKQEAERLSRRMKGLLERTGELH